MAKEVMLDLETMGTRPTSVILSIGAVIFDRSEEGFTLTNENNFYRNVDMKSCQASGLTIDAQTVEFWLDQGLEARKSLREDKVLLAEAVDDFIRWWHYHGLHNGDTTLWCHGPSFDAVILENAIRACYRKTPWKYNAPRDTRTIYDLAGIDIKKEVREGVFHNALDDCLFQVKMVQKAMRILQPPLEFVVEEK